MTATRLAAGAGAAPAANRNLTGLLARRTNASVAEITKGFVARSLSALALGASALCLPALAQTPASPAETGFGVLVGRWVRPDGGYTVTIKGVGADGKVDASYANPHFLPFSRAEAARDGKAMTLFLELRAGGYDGSNYRLVYEPASDVLKGVYYQAVAKQAYNVQFARVRLP